MAEQDISHEGEIVPQYMRVRGLVRPARRRARWHACSKGATADRVGGRLAPGNNQVRGWLRRHQSRDASTTSARASQSDAAGRCPARCEPPSVIVDIEGAEPNCFGDPEARGVARRQGGMVLRGRDALERAHRFSGTEHDREPSRFLRRRDQIVERPVQRSVSREGDHRVEKPKCVGLGLTARSGS